MPIRKLSRGGTQEQVDPHSAVSGAIAKLLSDEQQQGRTDGPRKLILPKGIDRKVDKSKGFPEKDQAKKPCDERKGEESSGFAAQTKDSKKAVEQQLSHGSQAKKNGDPEATRNLEASASNILAALHESKEALAQEMEGNLKHLKAILQETQRIAKEMEAVLREVKNEPEPGQVQASGATEAEAEKSVQRKRRDAPKQQTDWEPPDYKQMVQKHWEPPKATAPRRLKSRNRTDASWEPPDKKEGPSGTKTQHH